MKRFITTTAAALCAAFLLACSNVTPKLDPLTTPPPMPETAPPASDVPDPVVTAEPTPDASLEPGEAKDVLGNIIYGSDHFERYIRFENVYVYEENGDTFVDLTADNSYPKTIMCAVNIAFYAEDGSIIASSSLQMPDGSFMLSLGSGKTNLYARVMTDTLLTDKPFRLIFDQQTGVKPQ